MDCMNSAGVTFNPLEYYEFDSLTLTQFISHLRDWKGTDGDVRTTREGKSVQQLVLPGPGVSARPRSHSGVVTANEKWFCRHY